MLKNITLSAEERLIETARRRAQKESKTLNALFREWLARYVSQKRTSSQYHELMHSLQRANAGRHFSREELNER